MSWKNKFISKSPVLKNGDPTRPGSFSDVQSGSYGVKPTVKTKASTKPLTKKPITKEELDRQSFEFSQKAKDRNTGGIASGVGGMIENDPKAAEFVGSFAPGVGEAIDAKDFLVDMKDGNYGGAALSAAGFALPFVSGKAVKKFFGYGGDVAKKAPPPKTVDKSIGLNDRDINDYNYAVDMGVPGIKNVTPDKMDDLLKSKFNTKPMYRAVDVNTPLSAEAKNIMRSEGLDPDNLEHIAEYMGTHVPLQNITNKGRRTGHDKILEGSGKDIMYTSSDPEWIVDRYGGDNPYVVKTYEDQLPKNRIDQINKLSTNNKEPDWRVIDRKNLDLNKIPSGASIDKNALSVPGATGDIKMILGKYGEKVRDGAGVISGKDLAALRAKGVRF
mgnify:CR=1 FL=1|tara:strand:+ start:37 stop:1194 length:1158 start_codon:yes stop_codon:yes gene_type:complete